MAILPHVFFLIHSYLFLNFLVFDVFQQRCGPFGCIKNKKKYI